ncbi:MAG: HlyD family secretion protein [Armatimonadota bacterium]
MNEEKPRSAIRKFFAEHKRPIIIIGVILLIGIAALVYWLLTRGKETTDDAQIEGHLVPISSRVSGHVLSVNVVDNELVRKDHLLIQLDPRDYQEKVRRAEADLAASREQASASGKQVSVAQKTAPSSQSQAEASVSSARAAVASARAQMASAVAQANSADAQVGAARQVVAAARSDVDASDAQVTAAEAAVEAVQANATSAAAQAKKAASDLRRYRDIYAAGATSQQSLESYETTNTSAQAALHAAQQQVNSSKAALNQAKAGRARADASLRRANAQLDSAIAGASQAHSGIDTAEAEVSRTVALLKQSEAAHAGSKTVSEQVAISKSQRNAAQAAIKQSLAQLHDARLQLAYTRIASPVTGIVSEKSVQLGQYVQPGQMLMAVVPLTDVWVVANFKETQSGRMKRGMRAVFTVDAYPGITIRGRVDSIGAATVAKFSLLPPENASGNFVKVVQRIPVKIVLDQPIPKGVTLRPGQNVIATVYL